MEIGKTLHVLERAAWREWLQQHYKTEPDIWLVYYKKSSGKPRLSYDDMVEEALCFGWIDSMEKGMDAERTALRFTPRRATTPYSPSNQERLRRLVKTGQVMSEVVTTLDFLH